MAGNLSEIGRSGLQASNGIVSEEFLPKLRGATGRRTYREMGDNDPIIGGIFLAFEKMIARLNWHIEVGEEATDNDAQISTFVQECLDDMSESWDSTLSGIMSMALYGWSFHEIVYKKRVGPEETDPSRRSRHTDGRIGWRKWPIRSQDSLARWIMDDEGGLQGMEQNWYGDGSKPEPVPIEKALLFRTTTFKGNPEGRSLARNCYRPWYFKKRIEEIEAIGIERDLAGLPVARLDPRYFSPNASDDDKALLRSIQTLVAHVKRNELEGMVFPVVYDEHGNKLIDFELLSTGGTRQFNTDAIIARYNQNIAMSLLADFILLGHEGVGSQALGSSKIDLWMMAVEAIAKSIAEVVNQHAIPRLLRLNGLRADHPPKLIFGSVDQIDLTELSTYIEKLVAAGVLTLDDGLEDYLREIANLPAVDEEARELEHERAEEASSIGALGAAAAAAAAGPVDPKTGLPVPAPKGNGTEDVVI